jgi:hypothetical protein
MKLKNGSSNSLSDSTNNNSPTGNVTRSQARKQKLRKNQTGEFSSKCFAFGLGVFMVFVAFMSFKYWPANILNNSSQNEAITWIDGFTLPCRIKSQGTISSINRATSDSCKQQIAEVACKTVDAPNVALNIYPTHLPNLCPTRSFEEEHATGKHLFEGDHY